MSMGLLATATAESASTVRTSMAAIDGLLKLVKGGKPRSKEERLTPAKEGKRNEK